MKRVLVVPLSLKNELYTKLEDGSTLALSDISFLLVKKNKDGYLFEVLTKIPDMSYWLSDVQKKFTGKVFIEDIQGEFLKGFLLEQDKTFNLTATAGKESPPAVAQGCYTIDWFNGIATAEGFPQTFSYNRTEVYLRGGSSEGTAGSAYGLVGEYTGGNGCYSDEQGDGQWSVGAPCALVNPVTEDDR